MGDTIPLFEARTALDELEITWDRIRRCAEETVDQLTRKRVASLMSKSEQMIGNIFAERGDHRIKGRDLVMLARIAPHTLGKRIAEAIGLIVSSSPVPASDIDEEWQDAIEEFGAAGAKWVARRRQLRELRILASKR